MHDINPKAFFAAAITAFLFWGIWYFAHAAGVLVFKDWSAASSFLAVNVVLWMSPIFLEAIQKQFSFMDHGFALSLTAFASLVALGSASDLKSFQLEYVFIAVALISGIICIHLYIRTSRQQRAGTLPSGYRFLSWLLGVTAAEIYLIAIIDAEILSCS